jgi:hypothetical protein
MLCAHARVVSMSHPELPKTGYVPRRMLSELRGRRVTLRKGMKRSSCYGKWEEAKKAYTVTIDHVSLGESVMVGYDAQHDPETGSLLHDVHMHGVYRLDSAKIEQLYGTADLETLYLEGKITVRPGGQGRDELWVDLTDPMVVWSGTKGWTEAPMWQFEEFQDLLAEVQAQLGSKKTDAA